MPREMIPRQEMPAQPPAERRRNFKEVALGYPLQTAVKEAERCLNCKKPQCVEGCPVGVDIPGFIGLIKNKDIKGALAKILEKNSLPAICGRVCPQENQCEKNCILGKKGEPVAIGRLERFAADYCRQNAIPMERPRPVSTGFKVAVVGSGPAGLACAAELAGMGHQVTVMEALHVPGGVLMYGIPEFRLPKDVVHAEINNLKDLGVEIRTNYVVGKLKTVEELLKEYDAVFVGTGAGLPYFMGIPGENYNGVYSANEFLTRVNLMRAYEFPCYDTPIRIGKRVVVVGGGNVAMDAARTALRLGAEESIIMYRRTEEEMPARREEIEHAREEGVIFRLLTAPVEITADKEGNVSGMRCCRFELGEPDESGRRSPVVIDGADFYMPVDTIIMAVGQGPNPLIPESTPHLSLTKKGNIVVKENYETSIPGVFAGGDIVTGAATVILAMGAGKGAARSIDDYLKNKSKSCVC